MKKGLQKYSKNYVAEASQLTATERMLFVEEFMKMAYYAEQGRAHSASPEVQGRSKSKLISIKMPEDLLRLFRISCQAKNIPYQTQIKNLMREWLLKKSD